MSSLPLPTTGAQLGRRPLRTFLATLSDGTRADVSIYDDGSILAMGAFTTIALTDADRVCISEQAVKVAREREQQLARRAAEPLAYARRDDSADDGFRQYHR